VRAVKQAARSPLEKLIAERDALKAQVRRLQGRLRSVAAAKSRLRRRMAGGEE